MHEDGVVTANLRSTEDESTMTSHVLYLQAHAAKNRTRICVLPAHATLTG
jgi:hypothetical protein